MRYVQGKYGYSGDCRFTNEFFEVFLIFLLIWNECFAWV